MELADFLINYVGIPAALALSIALSVHTFWKTRTYDVWREWATGQINTLNETKHDPYPDIETVIPEMRNAITSLESNYYELSERIKSQREDAQNRHTEVLSGLKENREQTARILELLAKKN